MATLATHTAVAKTREDEMAPVHVDAITSPTGHQGTVIRDAEGRIAYPNFIPPETEHLGAIAVPSSDARTSSSGATSKAKPPTTRPSVVDKKFVTELAQPGTGRKLVPSFRRAGTNASQLHGALGKSYNNQDTEDHEDSSSDSSSSSSDEEGDEEDHRHQHGAHHKKKYHNKPSRRFRVGNEHYHTKGKVSKRDGRLNISLNETSNTGYLAKALGTAVRKVVPLGEMDKKEGADKVQRKPQVVSRLSDVSTTAGVDTISCPKLNIVIMVIGSRGDVQPFLKIGKVLKERYGHRVRIATHPAFRDFVEKDSGLEFFSVGGDPAELMAFMVKNPGMIPTLETVKAGDIGKRRAAMAEMFEGFWRSCIQATDDKTDVQNLKMMGEKQPFVADAIIANPPSFAHIHCAEALGVPLHLMFTFPYTPTQAFPHPLATIKKSNVDPGYTNFISYPLVEMMVWQGLGDLVNDFRVKTLCLDPVSTLWAPGATYRLHVPFTYLWSPGLIPKPADWGDEIDVSGFVFLDLSSSFHPPEPLSKFLDAGEPPIYIGFGSIVVDDANRFTEMIFEAVKMAGVRALVSKGWGGLGAGELDIPDNIFMLENTPHDWLFPKVRGTVIHGGAGTTAIALKCGKPTMVVPFFGDQHFWGSMIGNAGAGPQPVPYKSLTAEKLAEGIKYLLTEEAVKAAGEISRRIEAEGDGAENACHAFHSHLTLSGTNSMRCGILEDRVASWKLKETNVRLSPAAADILVEKGLLSWKSLRLLRHSEWNDFEGPGEPLTGIFGSVGRTAANVAAGIGGVPYHLHKTAQKRRDKKDKARKKGQLKKEKAAKAKEVKAAKVLNHSVSSGNGAVSQQTNGHAVDSEPTSAQPTVAVDHATHSEVTIPADGSRPNNDHPNQSATSNRRNHLERNDTAATASTIESYHNNPVEVAEEVVHKIGHGTAKSAKALANAPVDLSMAVAQGFHNAPRLYGDDTVRRPPRVTGIRSGLRAAGHEFMYGVYDGVTGIVRLPYRGAKANGVAGFAKGVGMGLTGFVLKDLAAIVGPVGYTLKGVAKQLDRGRQPVRHIRRARIVQGQREVRAMSPEERKKMTAEVARGWEVMRALWEFLETLEKRGHLHLRKKIKVKRVMGLGAAFESVTAAETTLARLKRGEDLDAVLGHVDLLGLDPAGDGGRTGKTMIGREAHREQLPPQLHEKLKEEAGILSPPQKPVAEIKKEQVKGQDGGISSPGQQVNTPAEEKDNPFSASFKTMERNRAEAREEEEGLPAITPLVTPAVA